MRVHARGKDVSRNMEGTILYKGALVLSPESGTFEPLNITVRGGRIAEVTSALPQADETVDCTGKFIIPGLVDLHTHGLAGGDFIDAGAGADLDAMLRAYAESGTTSVMPSLASAPMDELERAARTLAETNVDGGANILGIHLEGRYLNPARRGAHAEELLAPLDPNELERFLATAPNTRMRVSAALELDRDGAFTRRAKEMGASLSIAHTNATYEEAMAALANGADSFTHTFNAMPPLHHRAPGAIGAALTSDGYAEIIADGMHIHPAMVKLVAQAKAKDKVVLVTDSMEATLCHDGEYRIAGNPVFVRGGRAETEDGTLAGSTLILLDGVRNYARFTGVSVEDAILAATKNPAELIGAKDVGVLRPGCRADMLILSDLETLALEHVILGGKKLPTQAK